MPSTHIRIKRAFLQCYLWLHAPSVESIEIKPEDYRYELTEYDMLVPTISSISQFSCTLQFFRMCEKKTFACLCRVRLISRCTL